MIEPTLYRSSSVHLKINPFKLRGDLEIGFGVKQIVPGNNKIILKNGN